MRIGDLSIWEAFIGVAKYGNFSKASHALGIPVPQLSKRVAKLEDALGTRLFSRSTRVVNLTSEGRALLPRAGDLLTEWNELENSFATRMQLAGTVRLTCVPFVAHRLLIPAIERFKKQFSEIDIDIELSEDVLNLVESNIDLAVRIHDDPEGADLVYRKLAPNELVFCASPNYLKKNPRPLKKPSDLREHSLLMLSVHRGCKFKKSGLGKLADFEKSKWLTCENGSFLTDLALHDFGVLVRSILDVRELFKRGRLVPVLENYPLETFGSIYAVIPTRRYLAPRVRTFLDFLIKESSSWE